MHLLAGLEPNFDGIEADSHKPRFEVKSEEPNDIRTDVRLTGIISSVSYSAILDLLILPLNFEKPEKTPATNPL